MQTSISDTFLRRGSRVALLVGALQGLVIAVGWYLLYQTTHEQVAAGVESIIVQNNEQMAASIVDAVGGLDGPIEFGGDEWARVQDVVERVELGYGGFSCIVDADGLLLCHPQMRSDPSLHGLDLSEHDLVGLDGQAQPLGELAASGLASGSMDFFFDGKHYVASAALGDGGQRLLVHQPVSGLTEASLHLTSGLIAQALIIGATIVSLTMLMVFAIMRAHNQSLVRWNGTLDRKVHERTDDLRQALARAEDAAEAKATFLATMSHELRTPLNGVLGMGEVLACTELDAEQTELLETLLDSGRSLGDLLGQVLDYADASSASVACAATCDLAALLGAALDSVRDEAGTRAVELALDLAADLPETLLTDATSLSRCLEPLLDNAVKFTEQGRVDVRVRLADEQGVSWLLVSIEDTGVGIPAEQHERVFEHFQQADGTSTRRFGGVGLGLSLASERARALGGRVVLVRSAPGAGSVFELAVPVQRPQQAGPAPLEADPALA